MKKTKKLIFLLTLSGSLFSMATQTIVAQNKTDEPKEVKRPANLLILDDSKSYSLQNSSDLLNDILGPQTEISFTPIKQEQDKLGYTHQKLQQYYSGVKVEFGTVSLHSAAGTIKAVSSEFYPIQEGFNITPGISNTLAFNRAISHIGAQHYMWEYPDAAKEMNNYQKPTGELVIIPDFESGRNVADINVYKLAYKFDIFATNPISRGNLYIDANNGQALLYDAIIKHASTFGHIGETPVTVETEAEFCMRIESSDFTMLVSGTAATRYSGSQTIETTLSSGSYILSDAGRKVYTRDALHQAPGSTYPYVNNYAQFTDNDNNWTTAEHSANKDNAALDAHWGAMKTFDYWQTVHGRNSYDNAGTQIRSYVHVDNNYNNAFWNGAVMSYGDGSCVSEGCNGFDALTSIDVAGHEIGHAVTEFTANLAYQRESGGLNEGYSDIWGAAIEHFAKGNGSDTNPSAAVWLIGDEIDRRSGSAALRSMSNPNSLGQPDTYGGTYWINPNCGTPTQSNDYCGVHTNSGVLNYWFYLSVVGGSGTNDLGNPFNVAGIGMAKSSAIAFRNLNNYLTSNSTYANARTGAIQAAIDLYGAGGAEEIAITNAWYAVGVGAAYGGGGGSNYCASASTNTNDEFISRVQLGTINNASGAQFYSDFTSISTNLTEGQSYTVTVTPTWTGTVYAEGYAVWIDYNGDKDFADAGELVWSKAASTNTPNSGSFTVPTGTVGTATRMRVSMKYNAIPTACETFTYGEVEDYTVNLGGSTGDTQAPSVPANLVSTGVTQTTVGLSWNASTDNVGVTGYEVFQGGSSIGTVTGTAANITGLAASTAYSFNVRAFDAAGNNSGLSNTLNVTTSAAPDTQAPSIPTGLIASNITQTTVDLSWNASTDNVGVTGYDVYRGATNLGTVTGTSTQVTGLTASTAYSFSVRARDAAGNVSAASNVVNITTTGSGGGGGCTGGISAFPYTESFESGLGAWTQSTADDIDWTRNSGGTPSSNTGPTTGSQGAWYMYVEASSPNYPSKRAILNSPCFNLSSSSSATLTFAYHMYGAADMGSIALEASNDNGATWTSLWSQTGNKGNSWLTANINLAAYVGGSVQLRFNRLTGSTWQADIAIDNVNLSTGSGGGTGCAGGVSLPYAESFESSIGAWTQSTADDIDWTRDSGGTPSSNTGPTTGSPGAWYMYVEASSPNYPSKRAILNSPCLDLSAAGTATFNFSYHMYGAADMGTIALEISNNNGASWTSVWSASGNKGNIWLTAAIDLTAYVGGGVQLRFNRVTGSTWQADIAIDNISVTSTAPFGGIVGGDMLNSLSTGVLTIYPNPAIGNVLNVELQNATATDYIIYNMIGQVISRGTYTNRVDVSLLESGMYIIQVNAGDEKFVERFIKE
jgi:Zn-dependent metalloprotease/chitodextrinase